MSDIQYCAIIKRYQCKCSLKERFIVSTVFVVMCSAADAVMVQSLPLM